MNTTASFDEERGGGSRALSFARGAVAALAVVVAAGVAFTTVAGVLRGHHPIPFQDYWETVFEYQAFVEGRFGIADLWRQHNEHRLVLPRIVFLADNAWCAGRGWLPVGTMLVLHALELVLLVRVARWWTRPRSATWWTFAGLSAALLFWAVHKGNLIFPFQVALMAALVPASAAFALVGRAARERERSGRLLALAGLCALAATLSFAGGVLVWPVLVLLAWVGRIRARELVALGLLGAAVVALYLVGYRSPGQHANPLGGLSDPLFVLRYLARYLGSPLGPDLRFPRELLGGLGLGAFALLGLSIARRRALDPAQALGVGLGAWVVGTGLVSALGRHELGLDSAMSPRYETIGTAFWCALVVCAGVQLRERLEHGRLAAPAGLAFASALLALVAWRQVPEVEALRGAHDWQDEFALALASGVIDEEHALRLYSLAPKLVRGDALLREHELSIYAEPWWRALGARIDELYPRRAPPRVGELRASPLATVDGGRGTFIEGWCSERGAEELAGPILVTDSEGIVVGLGRLRPSLAASRGWIVWTGFASGAHGRDELFAWALCEDGTLAALSSTGG